VPESGGKAGELYKEYGPVIYRRCLRLLKDPEAARDATQEVFMKLVRDIRKLEDRATVLPRDVSRTVARKLDRFLENARKYLTPERAMTSRCPSDLALEGYLLDRQAAKVAPHVGSCAACQGRVAWMEQEGKDFLQYVYPATVAKVACLRLGGTAIPRPPDRSGATP